MYLKEGNDMAVNLTEAEYALVKEELESRKAFISKNRAAMMADGRIDSQAFVYELEAVMEQIKTAAQASQNAATFALSEEAVKFLQMSGYTVSAMGGNGYTVSW
jgi:hypothetical protein